MELLKALMLEGLAIALVSMLIGIFSGLVVLWLGIYAYNSIVLLQLMFPPYGVMTYLLIFMVVMGLSVPSPAPVAGKPVTEHIKHLEQEWMTWIS